MKERKIDSRWPLFDEFKDWAFKYYANDNFGSVEFGIKYYGAWDGWKAALTHHEPLGDVVITTDKDGQCVAVTRQNEEGRILSVIWRKENNHE